MSDPPITPRPSSTMAHAMKPTPFVLFLRTFFVYQFWRFIVVNLRMLRMIWKSHG